MSDSTLDLPDYDNNSRTTHQGHGDVDPENQIRLIKALLKMGSETNQEELFRLIVNTVPSLVEAENCSIFWTDGQWRDPYRADESKSFVANKIFRRATRRSSALEQIGIDSYDISTGDGSLTGAVAYHGKSLRINDVTNEAELFGIAKVKGIPILYWSDKQLGYKKSPDPERNRAFLGVPIFMGNKHGLSEERTVLGVIRATYTIKKLGEFTESHEKILVTFAENITQIILRAEAEQLAEQWQKLFIQGANIGTNKFKEYLHEVASRIPEFLGAEVCSIFIIEENKLVLRATTKGGILENSVGEIFYDIGEGATGATAKLSRTLRLRDASEVNRQTQGQFQHSGRSREFPEIAHAPFLATPLKVDNTVLGVIRLERSVEGRVFSIDDERALEYFSERLSILISGWRKDEELQYRIQETEAIHKLTEDFRNHQTDHSSILLDQAFELIKDADVGSLRVIDPDTKILEAKAWKLPIGTEINEKYIRVPTNIGITGRVYSTGNPEIINDNSTDEAYVSFFPGMRSEIAVPIVQANSNQPIGVINLESKHANAFNATHLHVLSTLAFFASASLEFQDSASMLSERLYGLRTQVTASELAEHTIHKIITDLSTIQWTSQALLEDPNPKLAEVRSGIEHILEDLDTTLKRIYEFFEKKRLISELYGRVNDCINNAISDFSQETEFQHIRFHSAVPNIKVAYPPLTLEENIKELLKNALDAIMQKRKILSGGGKPQEQYIGQITISTEIVDKHIQISIADDGVGLTQDVKDRIWESGYSTKGVKRGQGLYLLKNQIERYDGKLNVSSMPNEGSTFSVVIPAVA